MTAAPLPDFTTIDLETEAISLSVWGDESVMQLQMSQGIQLSFDNLVNVLYQSKMQIRFPDIVVTYIVPSSISPDAPVYTILR